MSLTFWIETLTFLRQGLVKTPFSGFGLCICVLGAVDGLLLSEKPKCNAAIRSKIKVRSSCIYLFTIEW